MYELWPTMEFCTRWLQTYNSTPQFIRSSVTFESMAQIDGAGSLFDRTPTAERADGKRDGPTSRRRVAVPRRLQRHIARHRRRGRAKLPRQGLLSSQSVAAVFFISIEFPNGGGGQMNHRRVPYWGQMNHRQVCQPFPRFQTVATKYSHCTEQQNDALP